MLSSTRVFKVEKLTPNANPESNLTPSFLAPTGALGDRILDVFESLGGGLKDSLKESLRLVIDLERGLEP